jgi:acyl-CoA hydrolase
MTHRTVSRVTSKATPKVTSAAEAARLVQPGNRVLLGSLGAAPDAVLRALEERAPELPDLTLLSGMMLGGYGFLTAGFPDLCYRTWFMPATLGAGQLDTSAVDFLPLAWTQVARSIDDDPVDVAIVQVGPPDRHGWCSLGISVSYTLPAVRSAKVVIAQVNRHMPRTHGDSFVHVSEIDALVEVDAPLPEFPMRRPSPDSEVIADLAADMIPPGVTLQPGIGTLPNAVMARLGERGHPARLVSMITDGGLELVRDNATQGCTALVGEVVGTRALYDFVDDNPAVRMAPSSATHSMAALMDAGPFVSVNSALEIDLFGQVNLEYLGGAQAGGVGGSIDFIMAANQPGNVSMLVMAAAAERGARSRIVPALAAGPTSIPRTLTQVIITEYGVADLRGLTVRERAERLAAIAHPDHRARVLSEWRAFAA